MGEKGKMGVNGDMVMWYGVVGGSFEVSCMGMGVEKESVVGEVKVEGKEDREKV